MLSELFLSPFSFFIWTFALLTALTIHEFSHALIADRLGDPTPRLMGRLTLNPFAHLDPWGTLFLLLARFGWGKPVPVDPFNLKNPKKDMALISLAGPGSNFILAIIFSLILRLLSFIPLSHFLFLLLQTFFLPIIILNISLGIFNLLPIGPLDGFKIIAGFLPKDLAYQWEELESYGLLFLFLLLMPVNGTSLLHFILDPIFNFILAFLVPQIGTVV